MKLRDAIEGLEGRDVIVRKYPGTIDKNGRLFVGKDHAGERGLFLLVKLEPGDKIPIDE